MAEWLNAAVLKTVKDVSPSGVRIPVSPQIQYSLYKIAVYYILTLSIPAKFK